MVFAYKAELRVLPLLDSWACPPHTSRMKTTVTIPDPVFKAADRLAQVMGVSRSRLYSFALECFVQDHDDDAITAKLDEVYATEPLTLDPVLQSIQSRSVT